MKENLDFTHPWMLWLLLLPPLLLFWKGRRGQPLAVRLPSTLDATVTGALPRSLPRGFRLLPVILSLALGVIALARPRIGSGSTEIESSGIDILLTLDVSGSMEAMDFKLEGNPANRLEVVKDVVSDRELIINHANWTVRGGVERNARVIDVSDAGDWSAVKVSYGSGMGTRVNPTFGFIYPGAGERNVMPSFTPTHRLAPLGVEIAMLAQAEMDSAR